MALVVEVDAASGSVVVAARGRLGMDEVPSIVRLPRQSPEATAFVIDLGDVTEIAPEAAAGVHGLVLRTREMNGTVFICNASPSMISVLRAAGVTHEAPIVGSRREALELVRGPLAAPGVS